MAWYPGYIYAMVKTKPRRRCSDAEMVVDRNRVPDEPRKEAVHEP